MAFIIQLVFMVAGIASWWVLYSRAGEAGWKSIVPIYNIVVLLGIVKRPIWWVILFIIPIVNIVVAIMVLADFLKGFGKPGWHVIIAIFLGGFYFPYLAFIDKPEFVGVQR